MIRAIGPSMLYRTLEWLATAGIQRWNSYQRVTCLFSAARLSQQPSTEMRLMCPHTNSGHHRKRVRSTSHFFSKPCHITCKKLGKSASILVAHVTIIRYPFIFTLPDGNLFIFANTQSIVYDYHKKEVVRRLPDIPGVPRSYPLTGGAMMLPLDPENDYKVEILICGGSDRMDKNAVADNTCGRINLDDEEPEWEMETFVHKRLMPDGVFLADGTVLWVNGCQRGWAGKNSKVIVFFFFCKLKEVIIGYNNRNHDPTFDPLIYDHEKPAGKRWTQGLANTDIARMYHSVALTIPDGRVWIAGSNNNNPANVTAEYPTEFRVEYFSPPYLFKSKTRPLVSHVPRVATYGENIKVLVNFGDLALPGSEPEIKVGLLRPGFSTHSMHMSQRYVVLRHSVSNDFQSLTIEVPPTANIFPPGSGYLFILCNGIPSKGTEIFVEHDVNDLMI